MSGITISISRPVALLLDTGCDSIRCRKHIVWCHTVTGTIIHYRFYRTVQTIQIVDCITVEIAFGDTCLSIMAVNRIILSGKLGIVQTATADGSIFRRILIIVKDTHQSGKATLYQTFIQYICVADTILRQRIRCIAKHDRHRPVLRLLLGQPFSGQQALCFSLMCIFRFLWFFRLRFFFGSYRRDCQIYDIRFFFLLSTSGH